jgi:DNA replication and repair protein RecF
MELLKLSIHNLRNLKSVEFEADKGFNIFYGANGAGKTSILEAIHILSHGRSFRGSRVNPLIQHKKSKLWVTGKIRQKAITHHLGIERSKRGLLARINGERVESILKLSERFPTLAMHPESFSFLSGEPSPRRSFIDWGVFYDKSSFVDNWRLYKKSLKQRNSALRQGLNSKNIKLWDEPMAKAGEFINQCRKSYISNLSRELPELMYKFKQAHEIDLELKKGWQDGLTLLEALEASMAIDLKTGYTHVGPHRADFTVKLNSHAVSQYASRGQLKLVTVLLKLAQSVFFVKNNSKSCILLLDDISAELDKRHFSDVLEVVAELGLQSFISSIEPIKKLIGNKASYKMFHVEQGLIREVV